MRGKERQKGGQNREQSAGGNEEHGEPAASRFSKVRCFFPVFVPGSRDVSPSTDSLLVPLSSVLVVRASWCPPVSPYTRHSSSPLSLSPPLPLPVILPPFSILPSFLPLCSSALSHLSGVSTSISKKSSRELFVGKCREPAVLCTG